MYAALQKKETISKNKSIQKKANNTGLPDNLKNGIEELSGYSVDDVKVHYNSNKPSQLQALAYTQGTDIHVSPGQEKYLPHEAWHIIQQKQGRVAPTIQQMGVNINDNSALEQEADTMGSKALQMKSNGSAFIQRKSTNLKTIQLKEIQGTITFRKGSVVSQGPTNPQNPIIENMAINNIPYLR